MNLTSSTEYAVQVKDLQKSFTLSGKRQFTVFREVNLNLPLGTIYGLLGPSGCGKTTLLKCILGRLQATQGTITAFGHPPGTKGSGIPGPNVGYMPQETTIFETMTISECMWYYGTIVGLSGEKVNLAIDYFVKLLGLPSKKTINAQLSCGQLRCVAFAVALMHMPRLLILDEPTVGIDCITKQKMWDHLVKTVKETGASIILTTHYIEEARGAHMVGMMHNHTLAEEDYTEQLLSKYNCMSLEQAFLAICCNQQRTNNDVNSNKEVNTGLDSNDIWIPMTSCHPIAKETELADNGFGTMRPCPPCSGSLEIPNRWTMFVSELRVRWYVLSAVIMKNFINLYRFPGALVFLIFLPCFQVLLQVYISTGRQTDIKLLVVNEDAGHFGSLYLSYLDPVTFLQIIGNCSEDRSKFIKNGKVYGSITIPRNFTQSLSNRIANFPLLNNETMTSSIISVTLDSTHFFLGSVVRYNIVETFNKFFQSLYANTSGVTNPLAGTYIVMYDEITLNYFSKIDPISLLSGAMVLASYFAPVGVAIFSLFVERTKGYLERTYVTGVSLTEIILGIMGLLMVMLIPQVMLIIMASCIIVQFSFGMACAVFAILYCVGVCGIVLGLFLAIAIDQILALLLGIGLMMTISSAVSGHVWPYEAVPNFFRQMCLILPYAYPSRALNLMVVHDFSIYRKEVIGCFCVLLGNTICLSVITLLLFKLMK